MFFNRYSDSKHNLTRCKTHIDSKTFQHIPAYSKIFQHMGIGQNLGYPKNQIVNSCFFQFAKTPITRWLKNTRGFFQIPDTSILRWSNIPIMVADSNRYSPIV